MKKLFLYICIVTFSCINLFSNLLVDEELYFNSDKSVLQGKKKYFYDEKNNIISVKSYNKDDVEEAKTDYIYEEGFLITAIEYNGKTKVKYSEFLYSSKKLIKKVEFDIQGKILLTHNYVYDDKYITAIEDYSNDNIFLGKKEFTYENGYLIKETQFDEKDKVFMIKKYSYNDNLINLIEFYLAKGNLIRNVEKKYSKNKAILNSFGYIENFYDIK
ncbi:MAG TPA: hypothetical protein PK771_01070 [Spirochaetota bacterium]|nr:hypothetical protein [Spirochaetota bacterium]